MTQCECPVAGFCKRHQLSKPTHWHRLCRTKPNYFAAWEEHRGPGQIQPETDNTSDRPTRKQRIKQAVARDKRLISWLRFLRHPTDAGAGDTAHRLQQAAGESPDAHAALSRLLKQYNCKTVDAVSRLNDQYPY